MDDAMFAALSVGLWLALLVALSTIAVWYFQ